MGSVVSDLNSTLVDTASSNAAAYTDAFAAAGLPFDEVATARLSGYGSTA